MRTSTTYNKVAWFYDGLCRLMIGTSVKRSQIDLLPFIKANTSILIVGGGTGWILEEITKLYSSGLRISYVDISSEMIKRSEKRKTGINVIEFIEISIENLNLNGKIYDVIFTPFLLDGFSQTNYHKIFKKLDDSLKPGGKWLYADFQISEASSIRQKITLKLMYIFFRITCRIEAVQLPSVNKDFATYKLLSKKTYGKDFIISQVFQK